MDALIFGNHSKYENSSKREQTLLFLRDGHDKTNCNYIKRCRKVRNSSGKFILKRYSCKIARAQAQIVTPAKEIMFYPAIHKSVDVRSQQRFTAHVVCCD